MRHIAITAFSGDICQGQIIREPIPREQPAQRLRLPVYPSVGMAAKPQVRWRCLSCNQTWEHEPLPQEAL